MLSLYVKLGVGMLWMEGHKEADFLLEPSELQHDRSLWFEWSGGSSADNWSIRVPQKKKPLPATHFYPLLSLSLKGKQREEGLLMTLCGIFLLIKIKQYKDKDVLVVSNDTKQAVLVANCFLVSAEKVIAEQWGRKILVLQGQRKEKY